MSTAPAAADLLSAVPLSAMPVEHICDISVDLEPGQVIPTPLGLRLTLVAKGGPVTGPRLRGEILPGGGDWLTIGSDGIGRVDVRATIRTDDGALIHFSALGIVKLPQDASERLARGERLPSVETYVRTTPRLETSDDRYAWLSEVVMVGFNEVAPDQVDYRIYGVL